jgi:replicative DNA helicase
MTPETEEVARLRIPPHSLEAEQSILGGLMLDNRAWDRVGDLLSEADFYRHEHRAVFAAIGRLILAHKPADVLTVYDALGDKAREVGDLTYLNALAQSVPSAANIRRYAEIVRERSQRRAMISAADEIATAAWKTDEDIGAQMDRAAEAFMAMQRRQVRKAPRALSDVVVAAIDRYQALQEGTGPTGWPIGIGSLDRVLNGGLRPGKVYGIAARPSVGKSSLARAFGLATAANGLPTLLLSQEMPVDEVADCAVAYLGHVDGSRLQSGKLANEDWSRVCDAAESARSLPLYIDDEGALTINDIRVKARMVRGLKVLILDYLQLTSSALKDASRNNQIEEVSRGLKALAMSMECAVVVLSQLNREVEKRRDKEPVLGDLRDSGAIEQDLDVAILLWTVKERDDGNRIVGCKVDKHRGGPKGRFALEFHPAVYRWYESTASVDPTRTESYKRGGFDE